MTRFDHHLGFIGAGRMATALARGFLEARLCARDRITASDPLPAARQQFAETTGCAVLVDNAELVRASNVVFLAVKPQQVPGVLAPIKGEFAPRHLVISIAAGVTTGGIAAVLGPGPRIIRVMPNTPCLVGQSASAYCLGSSATADDGTLVAELLKSVGIAFELPETHLDAVTGLSGSGPAFVYLVTEALSDGGVRMGLPRDVALALAAQTVRGAAEMVLRSGQHPCVLKDQVASPGGTTIAGLQVLEDRGLRGALMAAVEAATLRSRELGGG